MKLIKYLHDDLYLKSLSPVHFPLVYFLYIPQITDSVSKGCPLLEHIDLVVGGRENPPYAGLIALASLPRLRSLFITMYVYKCPRAITPEEKEDFRVSFDAIIGQGLLEVSISMIKYEELPIYFYIKNIYPSYKISFFLPKPKKFFSQQKRSINAK